jgi:recombination protein RecR
VVETPADLVSIERATGFDGRYFVLHGRLSPLDGVGPAALGLDLLEARLLAGEVGEVIVATGGTLEGEATAHYIAELAHSAKVRVSRLAHGIPMGGDLDHLDAGTLSYAMLGRREM